MALMVVRPTWARSRHTQRAHRKVLRCGSPTAPRPSWPGLTKVAVSRTRSCSVASRESLADGNAPADGPPVRRKVKTFLCCRMRVEKKQVDGRESDGPA